MKLLTKEILAKLPALYANEEKQAEDVKVPLKLFNAFGSQTWYITEYSPEERLFFGFCNLGDREMAELGYVSLDELESINMPYRFKLERDLYWNPNTTLKQVMSFEKR